MTFQDWIPAISTSTIVSVLGFICGAWYKSQIERYVQHGFDKKLEELKAELRKEEERFKAELRSRDDQIAALRNSALSGMSNRNIDLDKRRISAIESLWHYVVDQASVKMLVKTTGVLKIDYMLDEASKQTDKALRLREFIKLVASDEVINKYRYDPAPDKNRLFVDPLVWALFSAYRATLSYSIALFVLMRNGIEKEALVGPEVILDMVKTALPNRAEYLDQRGINALAYVIDEMEEKLFSELAKNLVNTKSDEQSVKQASEILRASERAFSALREKDELSAIKGLGG